MTSDPSTPSSLRKMRANRKVVETSCTSCGKPFQLAEDVYSCTKCGGYHHTACWDSTQECRHLADEIQAPASDAAKEALAQSIPDSISTIDTSAPGESPQNEASASERILAYDERECPSCEKIIKKQALKCRFCGNVLDTRLVPERDIKPPSLNWVIVFVLVIVTFGVFSLLIMFWQSRWAKRADASSHATIYYVVYLLANIFGGAVSASPDIAALSGLLPLLGVVFFQAGNFSIKQSIEAYYNSHNTKALRLSGPMTFFFSFIYFQYHFNRIETEKKMQQEAT